MEYTTVSRKQKLKRVIQYPCLLKHKITETVVWALEPGVGICVDSKQNRDKLVNNRLRCWSFGNSINDWELFEGSVTITNDTE